MSNYDFNQVTLIGYVGQTPRAFGKPGQPPTASIVTLATNKTWQHEGNERTKTHWHTLVFNGRMHELAQAYIQKGDRLFIQGELASYKIVDKVTDQIHYESRVLVKTVRFLTTKTGVAVDDIAAQHLDECYQTLTAE